MIKTDTLIIGAGPVGLFQMYQKMGLPSRKWKVAYIIAFILTGPLIYLFDGWFDFEDMLEYLFEDGFIFAGFLGLVPVFLFHMYLKVKERSKVYKNGKALDQLRKLNDLKKEGVITKAEYERLSKELKKDF